MTPFLNPTLVANLKNQQNGARYLAATYDLGIAEMGILETGEPFMALGGYRGSDPILDVEQFAQLVANGEVNVFLSLTEPAETFPHQEAIKQWVQTHCQRANIQIEGIDVWEACKAANILQVTSSS